MNTIVKTNYIKNTRFITTIKFLFYTFLYFMPVILYLSENSHTRIAQAATPKFQNKYSTIYIGRSYKYNIVHAPKNTIIKFSTNNNKLAKLNSKTGLLIPKKKGTLTLKAELKNTTKKTAIVLTKKVTIKDKVILKNNEELLCPSTYINSINFTVRLKCTRIMQLTQVEKSSISLSKDTHIVKGNFKSLSDDGRYITYELNNASIKLLSPGDSSMDGTYELTCTLSEKKYNIDYIEHMLGQSVTGFVFDKFGNALENASITLTQNNMSLTTKTDKNGYYIIRFPKAETVTMSVFCKDYIPKYIDNIALKITKSICKNIVLHKNNLENSSAPDLTASFKITDNNSHIKKIEISTLDSVASDRSQTTKKTFFTDNNGNLLLTNANSSIDTLYTDADIINISNTLNTLSYTDAMKLNDNKKDIFNFSHDQNYCIKIFTDSHGSYLLKSEFYFSFNNFISHHIVFNISLPSIEKTYYPESLLPITVGSNISYDKINYYNAYLYRIGTNIPMCSFSFYENTPADFKKQIDKMNLYLNDGNLYYALFRIYDQYDKELLSPALYRFEVKNSKIYFEDSKIEFNSSSAADNKYPLLPSYKNTLTDISLLPQDTTYLNTVLCSYNSYGDIKKTTFTSLSSQLLQYELLNSGNSYILYTDNFNF